MRVYGHRETEKGPWMETKKLLWVEGEVVVEVRGRRGTRRR